MVGKDGKPRVVDFGLARLGGQSASAIELPSALSGEHRQTPPPGTEAATEALLHEGGEGEAEDAEPAEKLASSARKSAAANPRGTASSDRVTRAGSISGTPGYMSPEQYIGGDVDALSDQFSFCAALYEALYGYLPFPGETLEQLAQAVNGPVRPPPPSSKVPPEVHQALLRGLSVDPKQRFPGIDALLAVLRLEHGHSAGGGALSRSRVIRGVVTVAAIIIALISLRVAQRTMATRDAVIASSLLLTVFLGFGQLQRDILLANQFHRRVYLVLLLGLVQNLFQRVVGLRMGWIMKQLFPLEMIVWSGVSLGLIFLGLRPLWPLPAFLLGMGALATAWPEIPKPLILITYLVMMLSLAGTWLFAGRQQAKKPTDRKAQRKS